MNAMGSTFQEIFSASTLDSSLEGAFLLKSTGILIAGWTRSEVPEEVVSVMAATMWGSLDTIVRTLGGPSPRSVLVEVDERRILALRVPPQSTLLLVAPRSMGKRRMRHEAQRILDSIPPVRKENITRRVAVEYRP